jgi:hypothetical protein
LTVVGVLDVHAGGAAPPRQGGQVGPRGLRAVEDLAGRGVAEHAEHAAQVDERGVGLLLDDRDALAHLLGTEVLAEHHGVGVHRDLRDAVREHVVHLAGDPLRSEVRAWRAQALLLGLRDLVRSVQSSSRREPMYMPQPRIATVAPR